MRSPTAVLLSITGGGFDEKLEAQLIWFARFIPLHMACREWVRVLQSFDEFRLILALGFSGLFALGFSKKNAEMAAWAAFALGVVKLAWKFPSGSNHLAVELLCLFAVAFFGTRTRSGRELLSMALRWSFVWVFFFSGVQKLIHGTYFNGQYFATVLAMGDERFRWALEPFLSQADLTNLGLGPLKARLELQSTLGLILSNAVWVGEILVGVLLVWRRSRPLGTIFAALAMLGIELAARELMFGVVALNLIALFAAAKWSKIAFWVAVAVYAFSILGILLGLPMESFN